MLEEQLYLLACVFASRADTDNIKKLVTRLGSKSDYLKVICVLWPELDDPEKLSFLYKGGEETPSAKEKEITSEDVVIGLLESDSGLIPLIEIDNATRSSRYQELREFINSKVDNKPLENFEDWLRERILICNEMLPEAPLFYSQLWETAGPGVLSTKFIRWVDGVIKPLDHLNKRLHVVFKINEWKEMPDKKLFNIIVDGAEGSNMTEIIEYELIPTLSYANKWETFIGGVFNEQQFSLRSDSNYHWFLKMYHSLEEQLKGDSETLRNLQRKVVYILFNNSENLFNLSGLLPKLNELRTILSELPDDISIEEQNNVTVLEMKQFMEFFTKCSTKFSFKEIFAITEEEESAQLAHFTSLCHEEFSKSNEISMFLQSLYETVLDTNKKDKIFTRISANDKIYCILEILLQMNDFRHTEMIIERFDYDDDAQMYALLVKFFWHFFNNASNGLRREREMKKASQTLQILQKHMTQGVGTDLTRLEVLLDLADKLSHYSINLSRTHTGTRDAAFKPSNILEYKDCPLDIISNLLELNPRLYKDLSSTRGLLSEIYNGLSISEGCQTGKMEVDLMVLHIDHALVNLDFDMAYEMGKRVFEFCQEMGPQTMKALGGEHWLTFYQMGKFVNPNWVDNEIPTEIINMQMSILGQLLQICPLEEVEIVTSQWSTLELELSARDLVRDKYALDGRNGTKSSVGGIAREIFHNVTSI
ncbi:SEC39-like protein [Saccharomyces kudriavzevii IFO 1802]|uniref:SEC39-like protein n=1 Tax=Saccharomyces kudriavzevii (strain ATCC MYA-4449 / AS 2.2408 / CBS 8840 / NBRC 1802 / NCYC 2889) TaxID=226230 RepID=J5PGC1_SACK1|nr:SEC39-like protein [Saccharomyces kudriavzevii IFO 1802]